MADNIFIVATYRSDLSANESAVGVNRALHVRTSTILPRDAMRKSGLCCGPVSVRLSVCRVRGFYPDG